MDHHLADSTQDEVSEGDKPGNRRNGYSKKTVLTENEAMELAIPRDRRGSFEPQLIAKYQRRFPGFDDKIISMYARGMSVREIQGHLRDLYGIEASPQLISTVTDAVLEEVGRWQSRPLDPLYALVFFDALRVKMRDEGTVRNKAVYLAIGVTPEGRKDVLGRRTSASVPPMLTARRSLSTSRASRSNTICRPNKKCARSALCRIP